MRLAVIIPTYNGMPYLSSCLPSVIAAARCAPLTTDILVVDDGSSDDTVRWVREKYPAIRVIARPENGGFARAANTGIRAAAGADWIALVNNDVVLDPGWIARALGGAIPPDVGSLATRILYEGQRDVLYSAGDEYATCGVAIPWRQGDAAAADDPPRECFSAGAAAAFYRADALAKCGLFRESLGAYYEDVDLGFRLNLAGYRCLYVPGSISWHVGRGSYGRTPWKVAYRSARNREIVFWGNMPAGLLVRYAPAHGVAVLYQLVRGLVTGEVLPRGAGVAAAVLRIGEILRMRREAKALRAIRPAELRRRLRTGWLRPLWRSVARTHGATR